MEKLKAALQGFFDRWNQLGFNQKVMAGTIVLALILSSVFIFHQAQDDYDILYANMSLPDAAATVAKLKDLKQPYKLADGGTTILVPRGQKNGLVLETANELTGDQTVTLSKIPPVLQGDVQKEWIRKLNTDSIAEILKGLRGIKHAQVLISQPEETVFSDEEQPVTASVMLIVEPGFRMNESQVKTVKNLVSHAVPGLKPENVAIADNQGNSLEGNTAAGGTGGVLSDADLRRKHFEDETRKKVLAILEPIVGKDNAVVSVSSTLNFDQSQAHIKRIIPATSGDAATPTGVVVSNQEQSEEYGGPKKPEAGQPGAETNAAPSYQTQTGAKDDKSYKSTKKTTNYANSEEEKNILYAAGKVERVTVAVVLNKVLTTKEQEEIRETVSNAAGLDFARGDSVDVKGFQFSESPGKKNAEFIEAFKASQQNELWIQLAYIGAILILGIAALFIFYSLFKKPAEGEVVESFDQYTYLPEEIEMPAQDPLVIEGPKMPLIEVKLDPEIEQIKESINHIVTKDPSEAARLLVTFMKE
jgi:flagellar M-ring protein FliF